MAIELGALIKKIKTSLKETALPSVFAFALGKLFTSFLELPHDQKTSTYLPMLFLSLLSYLAAVGFKIFHHKLTLLRKIPKI